jgi:hypothetical protein
MQYRPQNNDLIDAIQEFLLKEVLPFVKDNDALAYKTLVSWNMLGVVSRELKNGRTLLEADAALLAELLGEKAEVQVTGDRELWQQTQARAKSVAQKIRAEKTMPGTREWELIKQVLKDNLQVANPRYGVE